MTVNIYKPRQEQKKLLVGSATGLEFVYSSFKRKFPYETLREYLDMTPDEAAAKILTDEQVHDILEKGVFPIMYKRGLSDGEVIARRDAFIKEAKEYFNSTEEGRIWYALHDPTTLLPANEELNPNLESMIKGSEFKDTTTPGRKLKSRGRFKKTTTSKRFKITRRNKSSYEE